MTKFFIHINIGNDEDFIRTDSYERDGLEVLSAILRTGCDSPDASGGGVVLEQTVQTEQCLKHLGIQIPEEYNYWEVFITNV